MPMKMELGILTNSTIDWNDIENNVGLSESKKTAQYIANKSITLVKNEKGLVPLKASKLKKITHLILTTDDNGNRTLSTFSKDLSKTHRNVEKILIDYELNNKRIDSIVDDISGSSVVIVSMTCHCICCMSELTSRNLMEL